ncbi:rRNA 2'-O-methyltransferase fibrillarin-like [Lycium barbarum]|uniref:rRNA 2'-O-methyltransferase fibrillarin-like n=1 Tax=Lycium barbarum TaxID=112863 RepID=UPI00293E3FD1|nr:rRNA 2'-O-methyltransferase fibrillarin-like [Lycium barbarum]
MGRAYSGDGDNKARRFVSFRGLIKGSRVQTFRPSASPARGEYSYREGSQSGRGGHQPSRGGHQSGRGSAQSVRGISQTGRGGRGGTQSDGGRAHF